MSPRRAANLQDLIAQLHEIFSTDEVDVDEVKELMASYPGSREEWRKFAVFDPHRYTRNLVDAGNDRFNLMTLCWGEGHVSKIHDHAGAHCFMKVLDGSLTESRYAWPDGEVKGDNVPVAGDALVPTGETSMNRGEVVYINDSLGLHCVGNPSHVEPAVSLHLYSPPFDSCKTFDARTGRAMKVTVTFWSENGVRVKAGPAS